MGLRRVFGDRQYEKIEPFPRLDADVANIISGDLAKEFGVLPVERIGKTVRLLCCKSLTDVQKEALQSWVPGWDFEYIINLQSYPAIQQNFKGAIEHYCPETPPMILSSPD